MEEGATLRILEAMVDGYSSSESTSCDSFMARSCHFITGGMADAAVDADVEVLLWGMAMMGPPRSPLLLLLLVVVVAVGFVLLLALLAARRTVPGIPSIA